MSTVQKLEDVAENFC